MSRAVEDSWLARRLSDPTLAFRAVLLCAAFVALTWLAAIPETGRLSFDDFGWVAPAAAIFVVLLAVALRRGGEIASQTSRVIVSRIGALVAVGLMG